MIKPDPIGETTESGIHIARNNYEPHPKTGEVVAVGPGKRTEDGSILPMTVNVGDKVRFATYGQDEHEIDGEKFLIMKEEQVIAILEE